jgi:hypothetical protein
MIYRARYGVALERGPFDKRTADYVWMLLFGALSLLVCFVSTNAVYFTWCMLRNDSIQSLTHCK